MRRTPDILRRRWRFDRHERLQEGGSVVVHVSLADPRLERRRVRIRGTARAVEVYVYQGEPCFSPQEAASRVALSVVPMPDRPVQLELLA